MKVLFDTNVVFDVLFARGEFAEPARLLMALVERSRLRGYLCATTITTIHYLVAKQLDSEAASRAVSQLMSLFELTSVTRPVIEQALVSGFTDFEDGVLYFSGMEAGIEVIVTRDPRDFRRATIPIYSPWELLALLEIDGANG